MNVGALRTSVYRIALPVGLLVLSHTAAADDLQPVRGAFTGQDRTLIEVRTGVIGSDNYLRTPDDERSGALFSAGLGLDTRGRTASLDYDAIGDIDWLRYPSNSFPTRAVGFFNGQAAVTLIPDVFQWKFQETYGQLITDPFAVPTPDSFENVNQFTTQPTFDFRFNSGLLVGAYGTYSKVSYQVSDLSNQVWGGGADIGYELSKRSEITVNAGESKVNFDDTAAAPNYDIQQYFVRYAARGSRTDILADIGYSRIHDDDPTAAGGGGALARLELTRRISAFQTVGLNFVREQSSDGEIFRQRLGQSTPGDAALTLANGQPFEQTTYGASWTLQVSRTSASVNVSRGQERYEQDKTADRTLSTVDVSFARRIAPSLSVRVTGQYVHENFDSVAFSDSRRNLTAAADWIIGRHAGASFTYGWYKDTASLAAAQYAENRIGLSVFYRFEGR